MDRVMRYNRTHNLNDVPAMFEHPGTRPKYLGGTSMNNSISLRVSGECENCGKPFQAQRKSKKYCSRPCQHQGWIKRHSEQWMEYMRQWLADNPSYHNAYGKSEKGKEVQRRRHEKHPLHRKARGAVSAALRTGKITRPKHCQVKGCNETRLQAHHWKGYAPEHWLDIQWLCNKHHLEAELA